MCLDGVFTYKQLLRDFSITHPAGDQLQDLEFTRRNAQLPELRLVALEPGPL